VRRVALIALVPLLLSADVPAYLNHDPSVAYVGREACRVCHLGIYRTFVETGMGRSFYPLTPERQVEDFGPDNEFAPPGGPLYRMLRRDERYFLRQYLRDSQGRETAVDERELSYVVGSNNHGRGYVTVEDGGLFQAPVCWDPTTTQWILCPGFELANGHFSREISHTCSFCHNGRMVLRPGRRNAYVEPIPHGIGCERCHGPGQLHVQRYLGGAKPTDDPRPTIVNPRKLPPRERIQVCFQCHLGDSSATERVLRLDRDLNDFRPGMPITDVFLPFRFVEPTRHDFGIASQADRLLLSRCYTESGGKLECLTCHNPHISIYSAGRPADYFRKRCLGCHAETSCPAPAERRASAGDDCVACHMRRGEAVDRRYAQLTDHWIRRDAASDEVDRRTRFDLEPIFPEVLAALPPAERDYYRARAAFLRAEEAPASARLGLYARAEDSFAHAIATGFDRAEAWFFLGKVEMYTNRWPLAHRAFSEAVARKPDYRDADFALGQSLAALGRTEQAETHFHRMVEADPHDPMALAEHGRMLFALGRVDEALEAYRRAAAEEPWKADTRLNLAMLLAGQQRFVEAAEAAREAVRLDPGQPDAWQLLGRVLDAAGRPDEAAEARYQLERLRPSSP